MTANARHLAARLLLLDHNRRTAESEDADAYAVRVDRILAESDTASVLRAVLDLLADTDTVEHRQASVERCRALAYADGGVLLDEILGRRPTAGRDQ